MEDIILKELECPICLGYMTPPIHLCQKGHNICTSCKPKPGTCPVCSGSSLTARNIVLEKLADKVEYPCKFRKSGCQERLRLNLISAHQASCLYATANCPFSVSSSFNCSWKGIRMQMLEHFKDKHKQKLFMYYIVDSRFLDVQAGKEYSIVICTEGEIFFGHFEITDENFYAALVCLGNDETKKDFKWEVTFSKTDSFERITVCSQVPRIGQNLNAIYNKANYLKFHYSTISRILDVENNLDFIIEVSKI